MKRHGIEEYGERCSKIQSHIEKLWIFDVNWSLHSRTIGAGECHVAAFEGGSSQ